MRALGTALALVLAAGLASTSAMAAAGATAQEPPIVTTADAVQPQEDVDYTLLATLHLPDGVGVIDVGETGELALYRTHRRPHLVLLDAASGRQTPLPLPGRRTSASVIEVTAETIWYAEYDRRGYAVALDRYDRGTERLRHFRLPDARRPHTPSHLLGSYGGRWYFSTDRSADTRENLWSVEFGKPETLRAEGRRKDKPSLVGDLLTWTVFSPTGPSHMVLRDIDTDEVTRWEIPGGCSARSRLGGNGTDLVLNASCRRPEVQTYVLDRSGTVTAILRGDTDEGAFGIYDRGPMFFSYFYDLATGRMLDLQRPRTERRAAQSSDGEHPVQLWPQGDRDLVVRLK